MSHNEFIVYFLQFYGPAGLYPETLKSLTLEQIWLGIAMRGGQFEGDSFDREAIRDMILVSQNKLGGASRIGDHL